MGFLKLALTVPLRLCFGASQDRADAWYQLAMRFRGVDLRYENDRALGLDKARGFPHAHSGGPPLEDVLKTLHISPTDAAVDIGAGKGSAMITLAKWPFRLIDGIEISPMLVRIAQRNLARLHCARGTIALCDAADFKDFDPYTFLYVFNPFPEMVMGSVLGNLQDSLARNPRRLTLVYKNPVSHALVLASGFRQTAEFRHHSPFFRVYEYAA